MTKHWLIYFAKLIFAGGLIGWLLKSDRLDFSSLLGNFFDPLQLLGLLLVMVSIFLQAIRWFLLLYVQSVVFSLSKVIQWTLIAEFFALTLPGGVGTELARGYYVLRAASHAKTAVLSTVILDRIIGLTGLVFLGALSYLFLILGDAPLEVSVSFMGMTVSLLFLGLCLCFFCFGLRSAHIIIFVVLPKRFHGPVGDMLSAYSHRKLVLFHCFFLSVVSQLLMMTAFFIAARIQGFQLDWQAVFLVVPFVMMSIVIPISPAGIGVGEMTASVLFSLFGMINGAAVMIVIRLWLIVFQLAGGVVYLLHREELRASGHSDGNDKIQSM
jgi:glycosyltransferase 2 family protein